MAKELLNEYDFEKLKEKNINLTKADIYSLGLTLFQLMIGHKYTLPINGQKWKNIRKGKLPHLNEFESYS